MGRCGESKTRNKNWAMPWGKMGASLEAQHSYHTIYDIICQFQVAVMVCNGTLFKKSCGRAAFPRRISARRCRRRRWDGRRRLWGRRGRRGVRCWRRGRTWRWRRRRRRYGAVLSDRIWRRGRRCLRHWRGLVLGGRRVAFDGRRGARARARALGQEIGHRRQREMGRVVVVGLDRAKVGTISFRESP